MFDAVNCGESRGIVPCEGVALDAIFKKSDTLFIIVGSLLNVVRKLRISAVFSIYMTIPFRCATRHKKDMKSVAVTQHSKFRVKILLEKADTLHSTWR